MSTKKIGRKLFFLNYKLYFLLLTFFYFFSVIDKNGKEYNMLKIDFAKCDSCGECVEVCDAEAITPRVADASGHFSGYTITAKCNKCGKCIPACPKNIIY